jgi:basic membrane protein A
VRRHRKLRLLLGMFLAFMLLAAACGDDSDSDSSSDTTAAEGGSDVAVGLAYDLGGRGDQSFNDAAAAGLDQAKDELGVEATELEPDEGGENREELLRLLAEQGEGLVIGVGFLYTEAIEAAAVDFTDTTFALIDSVVEADNVANLVFAEEQGSFLVGAAAALTSTTGQVGFIGGVETELIQKFQAGFEAGVAEIDPSVTVDVQYLTQPPDFDGFNDPAAGKEVAASMYADGADVVYHAAGGSGSGLFEAAAEARESAGSEDIWAIGVDSDQYNTSDPAVQDVILTSMLKRVDVAVFNTIESFANGDDVAGINVFDLSVDGVGYSTSGDFLAQETIDKLEELKQMIIDGEIEVPTTP